MVGYTDVMNTFPPQCSVYCKGDYCSFMCPRASLRAQVDVQPAPPSRGFAPSQGWVFPGPFPQDAFVEEQVTFVTPTGQVKEEVVVEEGSLGRGIGAAILLTIVVAIIAVILFAIYASQSAKRQARQQSRTQTNSTTTSAGTRSLSGMAAEGDMATDGSRAIGVSYATSYDNGYYPYNNGSAAVLWIIILFAFFVVPVCFIPRG
jgi:hypothetical protein